MKFHIHVIRLCCCLLALDVSQVIGEEKELQRDYELEEQDDTAQFDFVNSLENYFVAEYLIEKNWNNEAIKEELFREYGIRDEQHWYQVEATFERFMYSPAAQAKYGSPADIIQIKMNATTNLLEKQIQQRGEGELAHLLEPIEGISLEQWAISQAKIAQGAELSGILKELQIDETKWSSVNQGWTDRMANDSTFTISAEYSKYFFGAGQGQHGAAGQSISKAMAPDVELGGEPPISFEKWVEMSQAMAVGVEKGKDPNEILAMYGMNPADWATVGVWWGQKFNANAMKNDMELYKKYMELSDRYKKKFEEEFSR